MSIPDLRPQICADAPQEGATAQHCVATDPHGGYRLSVVIVLTDEEQQQLLDVEEEVLRLFARGGELGQGFITRPVPYKHVAVFPRYEDEREPSERVIRQWLCPDPQADNDLDAWEDDGWTIRLLDDGMRDAFANDEGYVYEVLTVVPTSQGDHEVAVEYYVESKTVAGLTAYTAALPLRSLIDDGGGPLAISQGLRLPAFLEGRWVMRPCILIEEVNGRATVHHRSTVGGHLLLIAGVIVQAATLDLLATQATKKVIHFSRDDRMTDRALRRKLRDSWAGVLQLVHMHLTGDDVLPGMFDPKDGDA